MIQAYIVDDEPKAIQTLSNALRAFFTNVEVVGSATNVADALEGLAEHRPHLLFLDIEMGDESGFQLLEQLETIDFHVAFVTAHEEFALKAIKFAALDYLIKPASISELKSLINRVEENPRGREANQQIKQLFGNFLSEDKSEHKLTLPIASGYEFIKVNDILYLRAAGSYTDFYLKDSQKITTTRNLKFFESVLDGYGFFRIHNSSLINLKYIRQIQKSAGGYVIMEDEEELSISKGRKEEFMKLLSLE
ncbi:MAG: LytTR family DNA-binding domain-containing protein [Bacteroidota bacterium]